MKINLSLNSIRYLNLLEKISRVKAKNCFFYNNSLIFIIEKKDFSKAIGKNGKNMKILSSILKKRVRLIFFPKNKKEIENFFVELVKPIKLEEIKLKNNELFVKGGLEERSIIIGRNRKGEKEILSILNDFFGIKKINFIK